MKPAFLRSPFGILILALALVTPISLSAANSQALGWNNLGMHCMDSDYSVFSVLPPYNTVECQLIANGLLITNGSGYTVTYQAVSDPDGSFNSTSMGKGNYYQYAHAIYGAVLPVDGGLAGWNMPGPANTPQLMLFEQTNSPAAGVTTPVDWFRAEGIPLTPYDDAGYKNPYPLMRLIAQSGGVPIATNDVVLPVSDEMDCRACHASGTQPAAQPGAGWVWDGLRERDFRLNILRLHDEHEFSSHSALYSAALVARGFNPQGLYPGVLAEGKPVLCAACHASEALGAPSYGAIPALTASVHGSHAQVTDPALNTNLDSAVNRAACYRCHPGSTTRCLRGAMGSAVGPDGSMEIQCQNCHGNLSAVGSTNRVGWFMEPNCQACHTGTATANSGQIRFTSVFTDANGTVRAPANRLFATRPNTPAPGISLYRFSAGHGGLQCSACHGPTHAEFPSSHRNDNLRNQAIQGHSGVLIECIACHVTMAATTATMASGPHGLHPINQAWVSNHQYLIQGNPVPCQACHGADYRGTVLSRAKANRIWSAFGTISFVRGATVGCYTCHLGPGEGDANPSLAPTVSNVATNTTNDKSVALVLPVTGSNPALRIISQPANGSVGLSNGVATYFSSPGFLGSDSFTYLAYDGSKNSFAGTATIIVAQGPFSHGATAFAPPRYPAAWSAPFAVMPSLTNSSVLPTFDWDFGDGTAHASTQYAVHAYALPGRYTWRVISASTIGSISHTATNTGTILVGDPVTLRAVAAGGNVTLSWPNTIAYGLLEEASQSGPTAQWAWVTNVPTATPDELTVTLPLTNGKFFRVRRPW